MTWTDDVARYLLDPTACPRCGATKLPGGAPALGGGVCAKCGTDLRGPEGVAVWTASEAAAEALHERQRLIDALPTVAAAERPAVADAGAASVGVTAAGAAVAAAGGAPAGTPPQVARAERPRSAVSLQSVIAVVGAGLLAVAAIVFTFLNPDLTDFSTRTTVIAVVTALFIGGAWFLHRRSLMFSAEAIGALGMVFLALDVWAFSRTAPTAVSAWYFGALGLAIAAGIMLVVGARMRMRTWLWSGVVGLAIVPAFLGYAVEEGARGDTGWATVWGHLGVLFAAVALHEALRRLRDRFGSELRADRVTLAILQFMSITIAVPSAFVFAPTSVADDLRPLLTALVLAVLAGGALLSTRTLIPRVWSIVGGLLGATAVVVAADALPLVDEWGSTTAPAAAAAVVLAVLALVRRTGSVHRALLIGSASVVAAFASLAAAFSILRAPLGVAGIAFRSEVLANVTPLLATSTAAAVVGIAAVTFGLWALSRGASTPRTRNGFAILATWVGALGVAGIPFAFPWSLGLAITAALVLSLATSVALLFVPGAQDAAVSRRAPLLVLAHLLPVLAIGASWPHAGPAALTGAGFVVALTAASRTVPAAFRPVHTAVAFGYALIAGATALTLTELGSLPILCLTTTAAALVALAATFLRPVPAGSWYAILGVTAVPFGIGVVSVLVERSGWTALSTAFIFAVALALVITRRAGSTTLLRTGAATLLVPTLAVVVVCLTAELPQSGSPYALPIIAVLVALALPTTGIVRDALLRGGHADRDADLVRLAIEVSSLVTGAIAVLLALVRVAAGFEIAFLVLLIVGIGAAATALWLRRRYGWWTAAASWTGALWCAWALIGVTVVEPYLLPPAAAAMIVGAILTARRRGGAGARPAVGLFATGLGIAVIPSLAILAITGNGTGTSFEQSSALWRVGALLAAGVVLAVLTALVTRPADAPPTRFEAIRAPLLLGTILASAAGAVQGVRLARGLDPLPFADSPVMPQVLALALIATAIAFAAARLAVVAGTMSRWFFAPGLVFLVAGPMAAVDASPLAIWTVWSLEVLVLGAMVVTVLRARDRRVFFPPVWFQWALAWCVAVAAWSPREILRVEGFSLPLGLALVLVGAIALARGPREGDTPGWSTWPVGWGGSWMLLGPGIVATLLPSVLATFTSPDTWRAILVIALALVAVLIGARKTLAALFILGIATLPLEILVVFLVQLGETINPLLWWITLATAGIVLLVIAVGWERKTGSDGSLAARMRDLR